MTLHLTTDKVIRDVQHEFTEAYPYLKLEFFSNPGGGGQSYYRKHLNWDIPMQKAGLVQRGELALSDNMTVGELEKKLQVEFGLQAQVSRKSGNCWLETTMTDNWTLKQQNDHGRDLSQPTYTGA
jgi:hypothetical protein